MKSRMILLALAVFVAMMPLADAHFKLLEPASWVTESNLGDPQKAAPCGGTTGTPTNAVTNLKGGQKLHIKVQETVYHPGHYRVALAPTRAELPADPKVTTVGAGRGEQSVAAEIEKEPKAPVLADGLFVHATRPAATPQLFETDIDIPNINCPKCVIQIIQFMAEHGRNAQGDFSYHHCADVSITADAAKPIDKRWPAPAATAK